MTYFFILNIMDINKISSDINKSYQDTTGKIDAGIRDATGKLTTSYIDTERSAMKTVGNLGSEAGYTIRSATTNVVALGDNIQDNIATVVDNIRHDITQTVQIGGIIVAVVVIGSIIVFGEKLIDRGVNLPSIKIL